MGKTKDLTQAKVNQIEFLSLEKLLVAMFRSHQFCEFNGTWHLDLRIHLTDGEDMERDEKQRRKMIGSWCVLFDRRDSSRRLSYEADWRSVALMSHHVLFSGDCMKWISMPCGQEKYHN